MCCIIPVSYTHLDVYKRQKLDSFQFHFSCFPFGAYRHRFRGGQARMKIADAVQMYLASLRQFLSHDVRKSVEHGRDICFCCLLYTSPSKVLDGIHAAVDELNHEILPEGVRIHTFLDRTSLVDTTLDTVSHTLLMGMALLLLYLFCFWATGVEHYWFQSPFRYLCLSLLS